MSADIAIEDRLAAAGLPAPVITWWWNRPRAVLGFRSPRELLDVAGPRVGAELLELAERDIDALAHLERGDGPPPVEAGRQAVRVSAQRDES